MLLEINGFGVKVRFKNSYELFPISKNSMAVSFLSICAVSKQPLDLWRSGTLLFPLPEATSGVITMDTVDHVSLCLVLFAYLYLLLIHKEFVVPQESTVVSTSFLICVYSDAVGGKMMLKKGPMGGRMLKKGPVGERMLKEGPMGGKMMMKNRHSEAWLWGESRISRKLW